MFVQWQVPESLYHGLIKSYCIVHGVNEIGFYQLTSQTLEFFDKICNFLEIIETSVFYSVFLP